MTKTKGWTFVNTYTLGSKADQSVDTHRRHLKYIDLNAYKLAFHDFISLYVRETYIYSYTVYKDIKDTYLTWKSIREKPRRCSSSDMSDILNAFGLRTQLADFSRNIIYNR